MHRLTYPGTVPVILPAGRWSGRLGVCLALPQCGAMPVNAAGALVLLTVRVGDVPQGTPTLPGLQLDQDRQAPECRRLPASHFDHEAEPPQQCDAEHKSL